MDKNNNKIDNEMYLNITNDCNLNCKMCFYTKNKEVLSNENIIKRIIEFNKKKGNKKIVIFGGEPLLFPEKIDLILNICDELKIIPTIVTNMTIFDKILQNKKLQIQASLYEEFIDFQLNNIKLINNPNIILHVTVTKENINNYTFFKKIFNTKIPMWINIDFFRKIEKEKIDLFFNFLQKQKLPKKYIEEIFLYDIKTKSGRECLKYEGKSYRVYPDNSIGLCSFTNRKPIKIRKECKYCKNKICRVCKCDIFENNLIESQCYFYKKAKELIEGGK